CRGSASWTTYARTCSGSVCRRSACTRPSTATWDEDVGDLPNARGSIAASDVRAGPRRGNAGTCTASNRSWTPPRSRLRRSMSAPDDGGWVDALVHLDLLDDDAYARVLERAAAADVRTVIHGGIDPRTPSRVRSGHASVRVW